jgi:hypothetical protein
MSDIRSWGTWISKERGGVAPYDKPILTHHAQDSGDPIGRVVSAKWVRLWGDQARFQDDYKSPAARYDEGSGKIVIEAAILDKDAQEKVLDGRYSTFSSGQSSADAWCSVCGHNIGGTGQWCEHVPGRVYEVELDGSEDTRSFQMYLITSYLDYHEGSFVNIPGNAFSKVTEIKADELQTLGSQIEDSMNLEHADSYGVATLPAWSQVTLLDSAGGKTDLIRPEGAEDKIPYGRDNVRGSTQVAVIDLEHVAATADQTDSDTEGTMDYDAFAKANIARSMFYADGPVEVNKRSRSSDRLLYGAYTFFRTITTEDDGHQHVLDLEVNLRTGDVLGYTSLTADSSPEHAHTVEMTIEDLNALRKGLKGKTGSPLTGDKDTHTHKFQLAFGAADSMGDEFMSLEEILDRIQELERCIDTNELTDLQVRRLRPVADDLEVLEKVGCDSKAIQAVRRKSKDSTFCGPGRSFPVPDAAHFHAARKLVHRLKASAEDKAEIHQRIIRRGKTLGCGGKNDTAAGGVFARLLQGNGEMDKDKTKDNDAQTPPAPDAPGTAQDENQEVFSVEELTKLTKQQSDTIDRLEGEVKTLQSTADSRQAQNEKLVEENTDLRDSIRRGLAERLVFARMISGHADTRDLTDESDYQSLAEEYAKRTVDSLEDAVKDSLPEVHKALEDHTGGRMRFLTDTDESTDPVGRHGQRTSDDGPSNDTDTSDVSEKDLQTI